MKTKMNLAVLTLALFFNAIQGAPLADVANSTTNALNLTVGVQVDVDGVKVAEPIVADSDFNVTLNVDIIDNDVKICVNVTLKGALVPDTSVIQPTTTLLQSTIDNIITSVVPGLEIHISAKIGAERTGNVTVSVKDKLAQVVIFILNAADGITLAAPI